MTSCPSTSCAPLQSGCPRGLSVDAQCIRAIAGHTHTLARNDWSSARSRVAAGERNSRHFHPMTFWRLHSRVRVAVYSTSTSLPRRLESSVKCDQLQACYGRESQRVRVCQTFGERLGIRERARNSFSISSGSGTKITRSSAQIRSHRLQASTMDFVSTPMICLVVRSLRTVICVNRPKRNCSSPACSNQDLAVSECVCRLHRSASQTLASRKFKRVHRSAHSSGLPVVPWKQSVETRPALASAAVPARPHVSHREDPVHESKNQFPPPVPLISGKGAPECPPSSESILAS